MLQTARQFFDACETGKGWAACKPFCHPDATFSAQAGPLADIDTTEGYTEWMKGLVAIMPDARYELKSFAADDERGNVCAYAVFYGTHTEEGGPVAPTGEQVASDYVYVMAFEDGKISHLTKIWNAPHALEQLGWA
jgi:ketosteroid isomerase-like protein